MLVPENRFSREQGSSLIAVFWLIGVLGLLILGATRFVVLDTKWVVGLKSSANARNLAESGIAIGSHPGISLADPLLTWSNADGTRNYRVEMTSEEGLVPLNHVLFHGRKAIVQRLFESWGVAPADAVSVVDAMVDWTDANDLNSLHGAEAGDYEALGRPGFPFNRPFRTLEEVEWVMGIEMIAAVEPGWKQYFTLWSSGQIDLNEANGDIIMAALSADDPRRVREFSRLRLGEDGLKGTEDDRRFASVSEVLKFFGTAPRPGFALYTTQGSTRRIVSTGKFLDHEITIAETRRGKDLLWRMEY